MIRVPAKRSCSPDTFLGFRHEEVSSKAFLCQTQPQLAGFLWKQGNTLVTRVSASAELQHPSEICSFSFPSAVVLPEKEKMAFQCDLCRIKNSEQQNCVCGNLMGLRRV